MANDMGEMLAKLREEKGLTQQQLADQLGVSKSIISMYETGNRVPRDAMKVKLADLYETTVGALFFGEK